MEDREPAVSVAAIKPHRGISRNRRPGRRRRRDRAFLGGAHRARPPPVYGRPKIPDRFCYLDERDHDAGRRGSGRRRRRPCLESYV